VRIPGLVGWVINDCNRVFAHGILRIPVKSSHVDSLAAFSGWTPDSSDGAGGLDELREDVELGKLFSVDSRPFSHTLDFLIVSFVGILFGNHDIKSKRGPEPELDTTVMNEELGPLFLHLAFKCSNIIAIKQPKEILELFLEELSVGLAHFKRRPLDISDIQNVAFGIIQIPNQEFLTILDSGKEFGLLVDDLLVVGDNGDGPYAAEQQAEYKDGFCCHVGLGDNLIITQRVIA
jgi:hypothetical protein